MKLEIPSDHDGFILFQCPLCGEFFKLRVNECQAEDVYEIWCPSCGLKSENYLTEEAIELATKMVTNAAMDMLHNELKKMEKSFKGGALTLKVSNKPKEEDETPLVSGIDALEVQNYKCCNRSAKIKPGIKMSGSFCPYCGVCYDENE